MTMPIVEAAAITGGVDTHADAHVAAALDGIGGLLGVSEFAATPAGYARLRSWLQAYGPVCLVGIEGTGSYGAGLARYIAAAGIRVVEVDRSDRQDRRRQGKSDPLDAVSAARAALSGRASGAPRGRDGQVEAIRALMVAKRTARAQRTQTINQARALIVTGPDDVRTRFTRGRPAEDRRHEGHCRRCRIGLPRPGLGRGGVRARAVVRKRTGVVRRAEPPASSQSSASSPVRSPVRAVAVQRRMSPPPARLLSGDRRDVMQTAGVHHRIGPHD
jgi:hypothetical protein